MNKTILEKINNINQRYATTDLEENIRLRFLEDTVTPMIIDLLEACKELRNNPSVQLNCDGAEWVLKQLDAAVDAFNKE